MTRVHWVSIHGNTVVAKPWEFQERGEAIAFASQLDGLWPGDVVWTEDEDGFRAYERHMGSEVQR